MMALTQEKELVFGREAHSGSCRPRLLAGLHWRGGVGQTESSNQITKESLGRVVRLRLCLRVGGESGSDGQFC